MESMKFYRSKLKAFADYILHVTFNKVKNIQGKGENTGYPKCFPKG